MPAQIVAHLTDGRTSLVLLGDGGMPAVGHWGPALGTATLDPVLFERPAPNGGLDADSPIGLVAEASRGTFARPGIAGHRSGGRDLAPRFAVTSTETDDRSVVFELADDVARLRLRLALVLDPSGVLSVDAALTNIAPEPYELDALNVTLAVPDRAGELTTVGGRWAHEFLQHRTPWNRQCVTVENRHGKTSHQRAPTVFAGSAGFGEQHGEVWACHLAWSGNYELVCDAVTEARRTIQAGELLLPGELSLGPGDTYRTPTLHAAWSGDGLGGITHRFHRLVRSRPVHPARPRPVTLNTWEAVYFDHDVDRLRRLADAAAGLGIERFVLDDGWFHLRRNDTAGLGDWWVDPAVWPEGLDPIVKHVRSLGMEFGIWFEPEMVNPNSDLFRAHPDWALADQRYSPVLGRNQMVLDVGRAEVRDYLFDKIDAVLSSHDIAYVKWDHNLDLVSPVSQGRAGAHAQTLGAYDLLDRLRAAHPSVEIESCASGGGRVDLGVLARTDRVWASDSIDALDRHAIQRGFSLLFPPELMGSHIGSPVCHATGRRHTLAFRATTALFGHLGVEWNVADLGETDRRELADAIALHKRLRPLLHSGDVFRADHPDPTVEVHGVLAADRAEAVVAVTRLSSSATLHTPAVRVPHLDADARYRVRLLDLGRRELPFMRRPPSWLDDGFSASGRQLAIAGFVAPVLNPEASIIVHLTREP